MNIKQLFLDRNFQKGRMGYKVRAFVLHITDSRSSALTTRNYFNKPTTPASTHYIVDRDGSIIQCVRDEDTAWGNGRVLNPTWKKIIPNVNPNFYTISCEFVGDWTRHKDGLTEQQIKAGTELINNIQKKYPTIPLNEDGIILHKEIFAGKSCPGGKVSKKVLIDGVMKLRKPKPVPTKPVPKVPQYKELYNWVSTYRPDVAKVYNVETVIKWWTMFGANEVPKMYNDLNHKYQTTLKRLPTKPSVIKRLKNYFLQ